ncbi:MAG TPA: protein kinase [Armatimonadota bacterium]|nr:protein kinase [Armatimonadota bacterium]
MSNKSNSKITKGGLVGLLAGVGLATIFPPLGAALVIAGAMSGAALGHAMQEEEDSEEGEKGSSAEKRDAAALLSEFEEWDRRLTGSADARPRSVNPRLPMGTTDSARPSPGPTQSPDELARRPGYAPDSRRTGPRRAEVSLYAQVAAAEQLLAEGRFLEAIDRFRELKTLLLRAASGVGPSDRQRIIDGLRQALHHLAGVLIENDSPAEAEDLLKEALELSPGSRDTLLHLARLQIILNQPDNAEPYLLEAILAHPSDPEPYRLLGDIYVEQGRLDEARTLFWQAVESAQDSALTIEMLERISGLDPADATPLIELGRAQAQEGNWEEARRAYGQALSRAPDDAAVQRRCGAIALKLGRDQEGVDLLERAPGTEDDLEALGELAHYYAVRKDDDHALRLLRRFREIDRSLGGLDPVERRSALRQRGLEGDQVDTVYAPLRVRALLDSAAVEARSGAVDDAAKAAQEAIAYGGTRLDSAAVEVATAIAAEYTRQGNPEQAARWSAETSRLGGSLDRVRQERDTYEDFLRRFKYQPQDLIAEGGMARVYQGIDARTGRTVAIKRMHDRFCTDEQAVAYFYREVRALEELCRPYPHENIVEFIASGITESRFIFAMEFVDGPSLRQLLDRGERWSLEDLCRIAEGICAGLDRAHQSVRNIIHRDLKPENVLLTSENIPKLTDFGICRVSSLFSASRRYYGSTQSFVGTSLYSAPEQYPDQFSGLIPPVDARADLYSLGCILYEMLTTQAPFVAADSGLIGLMHQRRPLPGQTEIQPLPPPSERNPLAMERFSPAQREQLNAIVMRCLESKPSRRYRSAQELRSALRSLRTEDGGRRMEDGGQRMEDGVRGPGAG